MDKIKNVLLDIEGTICPISFVKETLFPYALQTLPSTLSSKWNDADFTPYRDAFPEETRTSPATLQAHVEDLTRRDVKVASLKNLQGWLWEDGYRSGAYATPLFRDVVPVLRKWTGKGVRLAIYSSGSVFAQKLLFEHINVASEETSSGKRGRDESTGAASSSTTSGHDDTEHDMSSQKDKQRTEDLRGLISGWFDTTNAGMKAEASSYVKIIEALEWQADETLFLSDNIKEVDAAIEAGLKSFLVDRPGNAPVSEAERARVKVVDTLEDIELRM